MSEGEEDLKSLRHEGHEHFGTVTAGAALDMRSLQLLTLPAQPSFADGGLVRIDLPGGRIELRGGFTYSGRGFPTGGSVTGLTELRGAILVLDAAGMERSAPAVFSALRDRDAEALMRALFDGGDVMRGSTAADFLDGYGGGDTILAGDGADTVRGLDGDDAIEGAGGDDDLNGNLGADVLRGGDGADVVRGGRDTDIVYGEAGDDPHLNGNLGDDEVFGGAGRDTVFGGQGNDFLHGDEGDDLLSGDLGDDLLQGGAGADRFQFAPGGGADWILDFSAAAGDRLLLGGAAFTLTTYQGQAVVVLAAGGQIGFAGVAPEALGDWLGVG